MPGHGELPSLQPAGIIGREAALATLRGLVDPVPQASQALLVTGEAGMGKTALLADAADGHGRRACGYWRSPAGSRSRTRVRGLHQLLRPVLSSAAGLPARQARPCWGLSGSLRTPWHPTRC